MFDQNIWFDQGKILHSHLFSPHKAKLKCVRGKMYDDLHQNYLKPYMHINDIEQLLGRSHIKIIYPKSYLFDRIFKCFYYDLGHCWIGPWMLHDRLIQLRFCTIKGTNYYDHELRIPYFNSAIIFEEEEMGYDLSQDQLDAIKNY